MTVWFLGERERLCGFFKSGKWLLERPKSCCPPPCSGVGTEQPLGMGLLLHTATGCRLAAVCSMEGFDSADMGCPLCDMSLEIWWENSWMPGFLVLKQGWQCMQGIQQAVGRWGWQNSAGPSQISSQDPPKFPSKFPPKTLGAADAACFVESWLRMDLPVHWACPCHHQLLF
jgi:hypothetical protein